MRYLREIKELNQVEQWKLERHPLDVRDAVLDRYAREGPDAIKTVPGEVERLKWVGLYPQRQGGDAFMLRIKIPGGRLTAAQARLIGEIADEFARGPAPNPVFGDAYLDITTRQDIQLHWIRIGAVPEIWARLEAVGITTVQACGDSARNVLCCPVSGLDADEVLDAYPVAQAISDFFTGNREYANLPRKFKLSVTGCREDCAQAEINDIGLWPARLDDGTVGFNVLVGGGLSDGPRMASDIDVFVAPDPDRVVELFRAIAQLFGELGNRENRGLARMRYLVQELGPERFRAELAARAAFPLDPAGEPLTRRYRGDHVGVHPQRQPGLQLRRPQRHRRPHVGAEPGRGGPPGRRVRRRRAAAGHRPEPDPHRRAQPAGGARCWPSRCWPTHSPDPGPFERGVVACTGNEFCRFAIVETKARAATWARELDRRLGPDEAGNGIVRMHFSGCPASCAQPQIADIGFRGETAHRDDQILEAVDIGLGGSLGTDAAFVDWVEGAKPVDEVPEALAGLLTRYRAERRDGEAFHQWARRLPNAELRATLQGGRP